MNASINYHSEEWDWQYKLDEKAEATSSIISELNNQFDVGLFPMQLVSSILGNKNYIDYSVFITILRDWEWSLRRIYDGEISEEEWFSKNE